MNETYINRRGFVTKSSIAALSATAIAQNLSSSAYAQSSTRWMAYIGTFSSPLKDVLPTQVDLPPGNGRGIYIFQADPTKGTLTPVGTFDLGTSPSCLAVNTAQTHLYSANETDRVGEAKEGSISSFKINAQDGKLTLLNTVRAGGAGPTYISIHPSGKHLLIANYFGGSIAVVPIQSDGTLGEPTDVRPGTGKIGPTRATNAPEGSFAFSGHDRTHAHMIEADKSGKFVVHADLGTDQIWIWKFDADKGKFAPNDPPSISVPPGDGPRHFQFHPNNRWFYSIQEEGSTVSLFDYDATVGRLKHRQSWPTLPKGYKGSNFCSEILLSPNAKFLYVGNRLHDSIGIFSVGTNGELQYVGEEWTRGDYPRSFTFDPSGKFLHCCNQRADNVTTFEVDEQTGQLKFTGQYSSVGNPSHIVFAKLP